MHGVLKGIGRWTLHEGLLASQWATPRRSFANVTLEGFDWFALRSLGLRGLCVFCGRPTPGDRPIWLKRSVASPLLGCADRPVRATH